MRDFLRLYLSPLDATRFKVIVDSPAGQGEADSRVPFWDENIDQRITVLKALEATSFRSQDFPAEGEQAWMVRTGLLSQDRSAFRPDMREQIGRELYKALFPEERGLRELLRTSIAIVQAFHTFPFLHVQITIEADAARQGRARVADYPWELICGEHGFFARQVVFSRYIAYGGVVPHLPSVEKTTIVCLSSAAFDPVRKLPPLSSQDRQAIRDGLHKADPSRLRVDVLAPATFGHLRAYLTEQRDDTAPAILHFDGHGFFGKRCTHVLPNNKTCSMMHSGIAATSCTMCGAPLPADPQGFLLFEGETNTSPQYVSAQELGNLLQVTKVALVVLSACRSGFSQGSESLFNGVAQGLIGSRVPAVVAMQSQISVSAAAQFAEQFYRSLGQHLPLVQAVDAGRKAIGIDGHEWYRPVLYLRWQDNEGGQLFAARTRAQPKDYVAHPSTLEVLQHLNTHLLPVPSLNSEKQKLLEKLHTILMYAQVSETMVEEIYYTCVPQNRLHTDTWVYPQGNLLETLQRLDDVPRQYKDIPAILLFVRRLAERTSEPYAASLRQWVDKEATQVWDGGNRNSIKSTSRLLETAPSAVLPYKVSYPSLLITLRPSPLNHSAYLVDAWLHCGYQDAVVHLPLTDEDLLSHRQYTAHTISPYLDYLLKDLKKCREYSKLPDKVKEKLCIEFFLPYYQLDIDVDNWRFDKERDRVGRGVRLVVRPLEHIDDQGLDGAPIDDVLWRKKWKRIDHTLQETMLCWMHDTSEYTQEELSSYIHLKKKLEDENIICLFAPFVLSALKMDRKEFLEALVKTGTPIALWSRRPSDDSCADIQALFESLRKSYPQCIFQLMEIVFQQRRKSENVTDLSHLGHHLTFFWDDPNRLPPAHHVVQLQQPKEGR